MSITTSQKFFFAGITLTGGFILALTANDAQASCGITLPYRLSILALVALVSLVKTKNFSQLAKKATIIIATLVFLGTSFFCSRVTGSHGVLISIQIFTSIFSIVALYAILWVAFAIFTLIKNVYIYWLSKKKLGASEAPNGESVPSIASVAIRAVKNWFQQQDYVRIGVWAGVILLLAFINPLLVFLREHGLLR